MYIIAIVQARLGSTRLPNKVMLPINKDVLMIEALLMRLKQSEEIDKIVVATSNSINDEPLVDYVNKIGFDVFQGDEDDVLYRYYKASLKYNPDTVVRITGDCPLVDAEIVDYVIKEYKKCNADYVSNVRPPTYPDGLDVEVFSFNALKKAHKKAKSQKDREHVTPFIYNSGEFSTNNVYNSINYSSERWTVDESLDYEVIRSIFKYFSPKIIFSWKDVLNLKKIHPSIFLKNKNLVRNEGVEMNTGQKLWKRAKKIIPGGNMLLSKRSEMFLPNIWPSYYSKSKGCNVWDMDGNKFIDMSIMGIGTNILGYGNPEVDRAVTNVVKDGNMSTFNAPEEVYFAEKMVDIHPWADMVRIARSGGEANAIAIRIARAASGKDNVAVCGYHGWHDWYLSANLNSSTSLDSHLLPGLNPKGVPKSLIGTVYPFDYNNFSQLEDLVSNHNIGVIKMEVQRNMPPRDDFLQKVRNLATKNGIVLIFDECTSGFREAYGGLHKKYKVEPDMAVFGKALGNGYSITAILGTTEVMEVAQSTFISSTFWTERIGPVAALKTLEIMNREKSWEYITNMGNKIKQGWQEIADECGLKIIQWGIPSLAGFTIDSKNAQEYKTLITQEMLKKGYLAANSIYVCTEHTHKIVDDYFNELELVFKLIKEVEDGRDINKLLEGPVCHSGFKRLN